MNRFIVALISIVFFQTLSSQNKNLPFQPLDVFELEWASSPEISPKGDQIIYRRTGFDIMKDASKGNLWIINTDGSNNRKLTSREVNEYQAKWSPDGNRIAFVSSTDEGSELYMYWIKTGQIAKLSQLEKSPSSITWSPDGKHIAFTMFVSEKPPVVAKMPLKPKGAKWAKPARITDRLKHERDGGGYMQPGFTHVFIMPSEGGSPRQITSGNYSHGGSLSFSPDGRAIYFSANRSENWEYEFRNSEVYKVNIDSKKITALTSQNGPDYAPKVSPNGKTIAFLGYKDKVQAYQNTVLSLIDANGKNQRILSSKLDRSISDMSWDNSGKGLYITYDDRGNTKIAHINLNGTITKLADNLGGTTIGRPYGGGSYSVSKNGTLVYTYTRPEHPSDIAVLQPKQKQPKLITHLNADILDYRTLGNVEEVWYKSTYDNRDIQGWIVKPPFYDASKKYSLLVENHGGPISNYGDRFSPEMQLYAADGYVVFYPNPRGSTSYGEEFANLLYNNYPGQDYNDVMDGVEYLIKKGIVDNDNLFVTGGSAGGIMTAWIIGKTNRFKAAAVHKPVINWISKTLVADNYYGYANSRYSGQPWENFETYWKFSPISLVGNVETPTMVIVGMNDLRTPPSEAKQFYHALKLRKIETVLVELPDASHGINKKPSNLISKVAHTLAWFRKYNIED
ncbi:alpha/beta hydrolase family protein [Ichthyenterobacterium magnum]|uniref:Dipeptidyl aminopeptidase/acylaminoacyl peptidase n=1 Tax=Ichthyenterobacterium magnum TaxID=1230530 RepID=A0A420DXM7_9FLAO|nr:S9 family peptidase [Ichthyenterobacterium magnum]RKE98956.1 dipeptidyl aminopeptidase/acylaminoacyl peptidase [Ichthyenterobacterium magnum]